MPHDCRQQRHRQKQVSAFVRGKAEAKQRKSCEYNKAQQERNAVAHAERVGAAYDGQQALLGEPLDEQAVAGQHARVVDAHAHEQEAAQLAKEQETTKPKENTWANRSEKKRLSYKEQRELEQLTTDIEALTKEKAELDALFASGEPLDDVATKAARYQEVKALLDEKEMRWLELSDS